MKKISLLLCSMILLSGTMYSSYEDKNVPVEEDSIFSRQASRKDASGKDNEATSRLYQAIADRNQISIHQINRNQSDVFEYDQAHTSAKLSPVERLIVEFNKKHKEFDLVKPSSSEKRDSFSREQTSWQRFLCCCNRKKVYADIEIK